MGCGSGTAQPTAAASAAVETPQLSLSPQITGTVAALRAALEPAGYRLDRLNRPYRPSEPASLAGAPRAVFQLDLPDPEQGYVVVYEFTDAGLATARGRELAAHLASGFGQTNYPTDAQFALSQVGSTLVFTWWSRERSSDAARAQGAFDLIRSFGQRIPVPK